ncbi:hypothetical protein BH23GEM9_BH23GEM9_00680 [soil metagenome]
MLYRPLRFIARHVTGFWTAVVAFLGLGLVSGLLLAALFVAVAGAVETGFTQAVDERVLLWMAARRSPVMDDAMVRLSTLGDSIVLIMLVLVASVFLWIAHHRWSVGVLLVGVFGGKIVNNLLKLAFARPRPEIVEWLDQVATKSFPSGHAMSSMIAYGSVAWVVSRLEPTTAMRRTTWFLAAFIIAGIGISRTYLGVHYPSDVIGGFIAGAAWILFVAAVETAIRLREEMGR